MTPVSGQAATEQPPRQLPPPRNRSWFSKTSRSGSIANRCWRTSLSRSTRARCRILLGPAGVGKSVLLKLANGLLRPDSRAGFPALRRRDCTADARSGHSSNYCARASGTVFQEGALFDSLTVRDNVGLPADRGAGAGRRDRRSARDEALRFVELDQYARTCFPASSSGGMRRRVAIARALMSHIRKWMLYDSPDRRPGPGDLDDDRRAGDEAARRLAHQLPGGDASHPGRLHSRETSLQSDDESDGGAARAPRPIPTPPF
jgi:ABC-type lipoprotein export system ATPase subunit